MNLSPSAFPAVRYFDGVTVHLLEKDAFLAWLMDRAFSGQRTFVPNHNLHSIHLFHRHESFRAAYAKGELVHVDGMPLILWGKLLGYPCTRSHRLTYLDWGPDLLREMNDQHMRVAYLGGSEEQERSTRSALKQQFPQLSLWIHHGYFDVKDEAVRNTILTELHAFQPHLLLVGMGMPRQELWIAEHLEELPGSVILPCGAFVNYLNGSIPTPTRLAGRWNLEWFFRFLAEPTRLFHRYFCEPWFLLPYLVKDLLQWKAHWSRGKTLRLFFTKG
jgi:N-acetylglucosaminyldiphosphoundecaprenol N-acetyl-beta-D-mannosaminyltransferase